MLNINPRQQDNLLTGTLEAVPINSIGSYKAVSYVWADGGPADCKYEILIRDGDKEGFLTLRGGLIFTALYYLRFSDRLQRVWAD